MFIKAFRSAVRSEKLRKEAQKAVKQILDDPLSLELIERIAERTDRGFRIVRPTDGVIFEFSERGRKDFNYLEEPV